MRREKIQLRHPVGLARARRARAVLPATPTSSASPSSRKRLKLHKNNVFRLLATLESRGYIEQNRRTENYRLGIRCLQLGQSYVKHMGLLRQARPIMAELARQARETAYVAVLRRDGVVPLEVVEAERAGAHRLAASASRCRCTARRPARRSSRSSPRRSCAALLADALAKYHRAHDRPTAQRSAAAAQVGRGAAATRSTWASTSRTCVPSRCRSATTRATSSARSPIVGPAYRFQAERIDKEIAPLVVEGGPRAVEPPRLRHREARSRLALAGDADHRLAAT